MRDSSTPLFRLAKRAEIDKKKVYLIRVASILFALLLGFIPMLLTGTNPIEAYKVIISGSLSRPVYFRQTIRTAIPLLCCAIAIAPCFKMKFWNIGAEGQITMGAVASTYFALFYADKIPHVPLLLIMFASGALFGAIWALIPAFFKAKWNTNETLFTLMMNYIAIGIVAYLQGGPWEGRKGSQLIPMFSDNARLPMVLGVNCGWIIALVLVVFLFIYMNKTKQGYEIAVVGESNNTARYAGINVGRVFRRTMFLSGALCGLVGMLQFAGADYTINEGTAGGVGFTAITVAWLAKMNPFGMLVVSVFIAMLERGANAIQTQFKIPASASDLLIGIILFFMLGCEFFITYKLIPRGKEEHHG